MSEQICHTCQNHTATRTMNKDGHTYFWCTGFHGWIDVRNVNIPCNKHRCNSLLDRLLGIKT